MSSIKHKASAESMKDVVVNMKAGNVEEISEKRKTIIAAYAQVPGFLNGVKIGNEKAFQEILDNSSSRKPTTQETLRKLKDALDEYEEVPMKMFFNFAENCGLAQSGADNLRRECQNCGALTSEVFKPKNKAETNFLIGEMAYYSRVYDGYHLTGRFPREIYNTVKGSHMGEFLAAMHDWYKDASEKLIGLGFSKDECRLLLGRGMTAEWIKKLNLTSKDALLIAEEYPRAWRDFVKAGECYNRASGLE